MCEIAITTLPPTAAAIQRFFGETSAASRRSRFHGAVSRLPHSEVQALTETREDRLNVYAFNSKTGDVLGVASAVFWTSDIAEVAVWVLDRCQGHGLGTALSCTLRAQLSQAGVSRVTALVERSNGPALAVWTKVFPGAAVANSPLDAEMWLSADVTPWERNADSSDGISARAR
jgi:ribosomal protein S18 acetylase RimI-like enzyme